MNLAFKAEVSARAFSQLFSASWSYYIIRMYYLLKFPIVVFFLNQFIVQYFNLISQVRAEYLDVMVRKLVTLDDVGQFMDAVVVWF